MPGVAIRNLTKRFAAAGKTVVAIDGVSAELTEGSVWAVVGENGAGKTTLLKTIAGRIRQDSGSVTFSGKDLSGSLAALSRLVGVAASDTPGFYDRLTGAQNLEFAAALYGLSGRDARERIRELLVALELEESSGVFQSCSAGVKQRWLLARSLLHRPGVVLWDEPTRSQGPEQGILIRKFIAGVLRPNGSTVLMATHSARDLELADGVLWLEQGRVRSVSGREVLSRDPEFAAWWGSADSGRDPE